MLLQFIADVARPNLKINFDPANMILYGSGDPLEAFKVLQHHVLSVHCKDGRSPIAGGRGLGQECALGDGEVDFPGFLSLLKKINYTGSLTIEREEPDQTQKTADICTSDPEIEPLERESGNLEKNRSLTYQALRDRGGTSHRCAAASQDHHPQRKFGERNGTTTPPTLRYSAPRGLRQGPHRAVESHESTRPYGRRWKST